MLESWANILGFFLKILFLEVPFWPPRFLLVIEPKRPAIKGFRIFICLIGRPPLLGKTPDPLGFLMPCRLHGGFSRKSNDPVEAGIPWA